MSKMNDSNKILDIILVEKIVAFMVPTLLWRRFTYSCLYRFPRPANAI